MSAECKQCGRDLDADFTCGACDWRAKYDALSDKMKGEDRASKRLEIAISLLHGQLLEAHRDGYDPAGLQARAISRRVLGALEMAEQLIEENSTFASVEDE